MATTALSTMRQKISEMDGSYIGLTTTTNIAASVTVIDTKLAGIGYHQDDQLNDWWIWLNTTLNASVERTISDHAGSAGSITIRGANLAAESTSVSVEAHKFRPTHIRDSINHAVVTEYPWVFQEIEDETLHTTAYQMVYEIPSGIQDIDGIYEERQLGWEFSENILYLEDHSAGFEDWAVSTKPDGSDAPTALTLTKYGAEQEEEDFIFYGSRACKSVATASSAGSHYWPITNPSRFAGQQMVYEEIIYSASSARIKVEIGDGASSTASTVFHGGTGWERVRATHTVASAATSLQCGVTVASGAAFTFYRDQAIFARAERWPELRWKRLSDYDIYNNLIRFREGPVERRFLRVLGRKPLSTVTADSDTVEIGNPETHILYRAALLYLYAQYRSRDAGKEAGPYNDEYVIAGLSLAQARRLYGLRKIYLKLRPAQP